MIAGAPIGPQYGAGTVWDGSELLVWGGQASLTQANVATGAAFAPSTGRWRRLAGAPIRGRSQAATLWTGHEMLVWGGYTGTTRANTVASDGAVYDPAFDRWHALPAAPLSARAAPLAVWTGSDAILLGGHPAITTRSVEGYGDGASYDPTSNKWTHIAAPTPPRGHQIDWVAAVQAGTELLAWSDWSEQHRLSTNTFSESGGIDLFAYDERTRAWRLLPVEPGEPPAVDQVEWTGRAVIVRGQPYNCGDCPGPFAPDETSTSKPPFTRWTRLPADPLGSNDALITWTGAALVSFNASGMFGPIKPGDGSVYDPPRHRWLRLRRAPSACNTNQPPIWTGSQLIMYCPNGPRGRTHGLILTPSRSAVARGSVPAPNVVGIDLRDATCDIVGAHLRWRFVGQLRASARPLSGCGSQPEASSLDEIKVTGQSPAGGTSVKHDGVIVLKTMCTAANPCS